MKKREIKSLTTWDGIEYVQRIGFNQNPAHIEGSSFDECSIKHIGRHIYLVGYFDPYITGRYLSTFGLNKINRFKLIFPSGIKEINYK